MDKQALWQLKGPQIPMLFSQRTMTTTKAFSIPMPERNIRTVRDFYLETEMSERHFRVFTVRS